MDLEVLVGEFADNVAAQRVAILRADPNRGNKYAKKYIAAFESLRNYGDKGRDALAKLLQDERTEVRVTAAAYLLRHRHEEARRVLEAASLGNDLVAFEAQQALARWKDGTLGLDAK